MKRIAGNIVKALFNILKDSQESLSSDNVRYYDSDPRECKKEATENSIEGGVNTLGSNSFDRAYASGSRSAEIQYC